MDFVKGLPKLEGKNFIMVVLHRITKYAQFCGFFQPFKASKTVATLMEMIQKLYGNPKIIINDRDPFFIGNFWT